MCTTQTLPSVIRRAMDAEAARAKKRQDAINASQAQGSPAEADKDPTDDGGSAEDDVQRAPLTEQDLQQADADKGELRERRMQMFLDQLAV